MKYTKLIKSSKRLESLDIWIVMLKSLYKRLSTIPEEQLDQMDQELGNLTLDIYRSYQKFFESLQNKNIKL